MGTIDLRVDYLRPAEATAFTATSSLLRAGIKWPSPAWNYTMKIGAVHRQRHRYLYGVG